MHAMTYQDDIAALRRRIAQAELGCAMARSAGLQEQYLAAYVLVEALDLQLAAQLGRLPDGKEQAGHLSTLAPLLPDGALPAGLDARVADAPSDRERKMTELGITYNGRYYEYKGYRYSSLADVVNYARLRRADPLGQQDVSGSSRLQRVEPPGPEQKSLMAELNILFDDGVYRFEAFRYERLADAVAYARRPRT